MTNANCDRETGADALRWEWLGLLARAAPGTLDERMDAARAALGDLPPHRWLRPPETGSVMLRGRTGGTGAPFNLGEMTVTRCTLALDDGTVGHAMVPGRDKAHAEHVALADALLQRDGSRHAVQAAVLDPLAAEEDAAAHAVAAKAAATKVDFFTMVRGEDE
ncbi:MAG: phosphonate C-P lyase system protein PhnG [Pseudomonadota bacterium]